MRLANRLEELIHLVDVEGRLLEARSQVRMAEESAPARAEGARSPDAPPEGLESRESIELLHTEIREVVSRELDLMQERRMTEEDDESLWW